MPLGDLDELVEILHSVAPDTPGEASPARVYVRTSLAGGPSRFFVVQVDPHGLDPSLPETVSRIDVDADGTPDLLVRVTPELVSGAQGVTIELAPINAGQPLAALEVDVGVRIDRPIAPPDNSPSAHFTVFGHDTGPRPLVRTLLLSASAQSQGTENAVGHVATTRASVTTDAGGPLGAPDHPLVLRLLDRTGQSGTQQATVVPPTTRAGLPVPFPIDTGGTGTTANISVPVPGPVEDGSQLRAELRRPGLRPHLDGAGVAVVLLSEVRRVAATGTVDRTRVEWDCPHAVSLVLALDDLVSLRRTVIDTSALPTELEVDNDPVRTPASRPHLELRASGPLTLLHVRDEQPAGSGRFRHLAATVEAIPESLGLRLDADPGEPLRVIVSSRADVAQPLEPPLGGAAVLLARLPSQLPPATGAVPTPLALAEQAVAVDLDDVPAESLAPRPRIFASVRALRHVRVEENTPAPQPAHANDSAGLVVQLSLADPPGGRERSLRFHQFRQVEPDPAPAHTRLLVRAGELPETAILDLRTAPAGYFGMRLWGSCRFVHVLHLDRATSRDAVEGHPLRLRVAVPRTPAGFVDVKRDETGMFVTGTEPVEVEVGLGDDRGLGEDRLVNRIVASLRLSESASLPAVADGFQVDATAGGLSGRVAITGHAVPPLAVRATPQVATLQRPGPDTRPDTEALTARALGVRHVRQGGLQAGEGEDPRDLTRVLMQLDPGRVNRALRVRQLDRELASEPPREALKLRVASVPASLELEQRKGTQAGDEGVGPWTSRVPAKLTLRLSEPGGQAVLWSEPRERAFDGPREGAFAGIGVLWLSVDAVPRRLVVTPLTDGRYAAEETRPGNWPEIPDEWTRDGLRIQASDPLAVREMLKASWDRDRPNGTRSAWSLLYIRLLELALEPVAEGAPEDVLPAMYLWNPGLRPAAGGSFGEPPAVLGVRAGAGVRATLDLDRYEQGTSEPAPRWDELPGGGWDLLAEVQLLEYGNQVSAGEAFGKTHPWRGGDGPGLWWVRATDKWPWFFGTGSIAIGNTGGQNRFHQHRIFQ